MGALRKLLAWLSVPVLCLVGLIVFIARPFNPDNNRLLAIVVARTGRGLLGMRRPVEGLENMPVNRPVVVIANHQHNDDLFVVGDLMPPRTVTVGKSSLVWTPFFGQVFWLGGNIILNRAHSRKAVAIMQATSEAITRDRKSLWVFPEGTRSRGRGLQAFKKGAFHVAITSGAPIVMICVEQYQAQHVGWSGRRKSVSVRILPPVETKDMAATDIRELMARCHQQMADTIASL
jgi:1-acyl-sn-glycerol-3-phosphate acyltransferase